jgi:hypothetical protein
MMPLDKAIGTAMKRAEFLYGLIEAKEAEWGCLDAHHRSEIGMLRALMFAVGVRKEQLPETPFLEPAHLQAFKDKIKQSKREKGDLSHADL